jgi:hypothetical protein
MTASTQVATLNRAQPYPVFKFLQQNSSCHMDQAKTETVPRQMRASGADGLPLGEIRNGAEWNVIPPVSPLGPEIARK